ncbi:MAG: MFS transporter [Steroidobacteraceae bacterium]
MTTSSPVVAQRFVFAGMAICVIAMASLLWMPALLGVLAKGYGMTPQQLSYLAFAETIGFMLGALATSGQTLRFLVRAVPIACAVLIALNLALVLFAPPESFLVIRALAGIASGVGYCYALKVCGMSSHPTRNFGLLTGAMSLMMIIGFQTLAFVIDSRVGGSQVSAAGGYQDAAHVAFGAYAAFAALAAVILLFNRPPQAAIDERAATRSAGGLSAPVLIGLLSIVLSFIGQGSIWAFLQTLGVAHGFSVTGVANAMSVWAIMGIAGSLAAAVLPSGVSRSLALGIALITLWCGLYALYAPRSLAWYVVGCAIGGGYWNFFISVLLGLLARIDHTGRGSVLGGTISSAGAATGPLFAGMLIVGNNYQPVGWMTLTLCTIGFLCAWYIERRSSPAQTITNESTGGLATEVSMVKK